jgi:hypothetical protein
LCIPSCRWKHGFSADNKLNEHLSTNCDFHSAPSQNKKISQTEGVAGRSRRNANFLFGTDPIIFRGYLAMRELSPIILRFCNDLLRVSKAYLTQVHATGSKGAKPTMHHHTPLQLQPM